MLFQPISLSSARQSVDKRVKFFATWLAGEEIRAKIPFGRLAQLVAQHDHTVKVGGSNPSSPKFFNWSGKLMAMAGFIQV